VLHGDKRIKARERCGERVRERLRERYTEGGRDKEKLGYIEEGKRMR
jgi:hypothetical protein